MWKNTGYGCHIRKIANVFILRIYQSIGEAGKETPDLQVFIDDARFIKTFPPTEQGVQDAKDFLEKETARRFELGLQELRGTKCQS